MEIKISLIPFILLLPFMLSALLAAFVILFPIGLLLLVFYAIISILEALLSIFNKGRI